MGIVDFINNSSERSFRRNLLELYDGARRRVAPKKSIGPSIYEYDWDVLIILDACRPDTFRNVGRPFIEQSHVMELVEEDTIRSIASQSYEWLIRTFIENYCLDVSQTAYVTANVYAAKAFDGQAGRHPFYELKEVWRTDWDEEIGTVRAEAVTEAAKPYVDIENNENGPHKVIVHYMQPHFPSVPNPIAEQKTPVEFGYDGQQIKFAWNKLQDREVSKEQVRNSFRDNLQYVLNSVEELVEGSSGKVVISSDHGQSFGEWGVFGHPPSTATKEVLEVPWIVVQERTNSTGFEANTQDEVEEKLAALGYK